MNDDFDELAFLARSECRMAILETLADEARDLRDLSDELDVPRTTLSDNLLRLEEKRWIERADGVYRITMLGRSVRRIADSCLRSMQAARELSPFLETVSDVPDVIDVECLHGSTVVRADFPEPYAPVEQLLDAVDGASTLRGLTPVALPSFGEFFREQVLTEGLEVDLVIDEQLLGVIPEAVITQMRPGSAAGRVRFGVYGGDIPFGLLLLDDRLVLASTNEDGLIEAAVLNDSPDAYEWGESVYGSYRSEVERFLP